jgi:hypothetical protein
MTRDLVGREMKIWDFKPDARLLDQKMHRHGQLLHSTPEILAVLASNVVG